MRTEITILECDLCKATARTSGDRLKGWRTLGESSFTPETDVCPACITLIRKLRGIGARRTKQLIKSTT